MRIYLYKRKEFIMIICCDFFANIARKIIVKLTRMDVFLHVFLLTLGGRNI